MYKIECTPAHGHPIAFPSIAFPSEESIHVVSEPGEYEVIKDGTKLEDCGGSVEVEMGRWVGP